MLHKQNVKKIVLHPFKTNYKIMTLSSTSQPLKIFKYIAVSCHSLDVIER